MVIVARSVDIEVDDALEDREELHLAAFCLGTALKLTEEHLVRHVVAFFKCCSFACPDLWDRAMSIVLLQTERQRPGPVPIALA